MEKKEKEAQRKSINDEELALKAKKIELKDEQKTTLFLVTHSRELAKKCDRIIKIRDGKLQ